VPIERRTRTEISKCPGFIRCDGKILAFLLGAHVP
jgi:hypothetical protein